VNWRLVSPPTFYCVFWVLFQAAFWILAWFLGPSLIAKGIALSQGQK